MKAGGLQVGRKCLKCGYERMAHDIVPEYECPQCGAIYSKVEALKSLNSNKISHTGDHDKSKQQKQKPSIQKRNKNTNSTSSKQDSNFDQSRGSRASHLILLIVCILSLIIGYFAGREHIKYEISTEIATVANKIENVVVTNQTITIFMQGDPGTNYTGHIDVVSSNGSSRGETVEGSVPQVYTFNGAIVSAQFQKKDDNSNTLMTLITNEQNYPNPIKIAQTAVPFGVVSVVLGR